jgi:hypothetical protein
MVSKPLDSKMETKADDKASAAPEGANVKEASPAQETTQQAWEQHEGKPWNSSPQGRFAIRVVTRGVLGAAFFTVGGALTTKWLQNYNSEASLLKQDNPLAFISKLVDAGVGKPIEAVVNAIGKDGKRMVTFRPAGLGHTSHRVSGRSLGHEVSAVSFDFFCASIGDAWGRDIAGWIDPNVKKDWMKDGKIEWPAAIKQAMKSTWRYVTYNGGEDWAVAIPYVYFMKGHRRLVDHISPGFKYDFDRNLNGGSARFSGGEHVGNFNRGGIMDLQHRFVVYNMGTVAYRELYTFIGEKLQGKQTSLYGAQDKEPPNSIGEKLANTAKWMVRSVVKAGIYMTPAVPFFWFLRTPQTKFRGLVIDDEHGTLVRKKMDGDKYVMVGGQQLAETELEHALERGMQHAYEPVTVNMNVKGKELEWMKHNPVTNQVSFSPAKEHPLKAGAFHHNAAVGGTVQAGLRGLTSVSDAVREPFERLGGKLDEVVVNQRKLGDIAQRNMGSSLRNMANTYVNSAMSYTPYMYAKAEFANLWDDGKMDMSIERAIDGATRLNFGEFREGLRDIGYSIMHKPLRDPKREAEAQRRIAIDESAADVLTETKAQMHQVDEVHRNLDDTRANRHKLNWRERIVAGKKEDAPIVGANKPKNYTEAEAMRKALEELQPPTNSIN